ncbi:ABC transporter permease/substrate binding protein [Tuanshanicoccus lijuaniae]|uniref:ABC transporter permease/substrate binding protein n=1 Tax=Aerococcaceae bacterium zg-1292 TaxID=2774330 RepID=UPI001936B39A|nr:ABC transporter permease/substrate binding protein [Aerococcaceae bacterium zg-1292]QQA37749.1 ABC transporter permease/substrate binding protein [Aerococcaceae bacterium zg-1292]
MNHFLTHPIPLADWVNQATDWITDTFGGLFKILQTLGEFVMNSITNLLTSIPALLMILLITVGMYFLSKRSKGLSLFTLLGLLFVYNQGLWTMLMSTLTLVLVSSLISIVIGVPLGILMAKNKVAANIIAPILDFMQTMPSFVYLIPAVAFFGIGMVPGVFASVIFALPPTVRFTNLGIRQVPKELVEASQAFGSTGMQRLFKLDLPMAKDTIFAGINQTTMLALSMVVTASMIGAPGLGEGVLTALQKADIGSGFVYGVSLVILAIIVDRFTQLLNRPRIAQTKVEKQQSRKKQITIGMAALALLIGSAGYSYFSKGNTQTVTLASTQWDADLASSSVVKLILEEMGYQVEVKSLDNAVLFASVASGEADGTLVPWLPYTQAALYEEYGDQMVELGPNTTGAKLGLAVPTYMENIHSIADLTDEAGKVITGIEPGAGITKTTNKTIETYPNLKGWTQKTSSTGAMTTQLEQALKNKEEIVITGWTPHWMFERFDIKYLEDPEGTMGGEEQVVTFARKGLKEDMPEVYHILDQFEWDISELESFMDELESGTPAEQIAKKWISNHRELVDRWIEAARQ